MTEWEQIKKEYREIPIPTDGPHQMLEVIAVAKRRRNRWKHIVKYGSLVAAAMLVIMILPGIFLFSGGFGGSSDMAAPESAVSKEESTGNGGWFMMDAAESVMDNDMALPPGTSAPEEGYEGKTNSGGSSMNDFQTEANNSDDANYGINNSVSGVENEAEAIPTPAVGQSNPAQSADKAVGEQEKIVLPREVISKEILRQMEERMQVKGETYYIKSEAYPDGFEMISEEQAYYVNEEGLLVIVFEAGMVAPEEQGIVEFVIPAEVTAP